MAEKETAAEKAAAKERKEAEKNQADASVDDAPPGGMVGSPTGPVPVSAVARTEEEAEKLLEAQAEAVEASQRSSVTTEITEDELERMSASEIRAVAADRGYDLGPRAGRHRTTQAFVRLQEEDEYIEKSKKSKK